MPVVLAHVSKIRRDFATGHGKMNKKKTEDYDEDGSHNIAFQTLHLASTAGDVI